MDQLTKWQLATVKSIQVLYEDDDLPENADEQLETLDRQSVLLGDGPELEAMIRLVRARDGRRLALSNLYNMFSQYCQAGGKLDRWHFLHTAELFEVQRLFGEQEVEASLIRGTSALEHTLEEEVDITAHWPDYDPDEDYTRFVKLIDWAFEDGVMTYQDLKLHHFVRTVRNRFAHHTWLDRGDDFDILVLSGRVIIYLLDAHVQARFNAIEEVELENFIEGLDPDEAYLGVIEDDHGWEFREFQKRWRVPDSQS
ncbi:hypothetical protein [Haloprofundus salinisoli]|uniref:hypothetical protein n=1 Tax=Haloprofundus salinisoli TaxID=2876193 RepID=UPI001CC98C01|nr:hypothetical protein [Haloprofundus salinisoli]